MPRDFDGSRFKAEYLFDSRTKIRVVGHQNPDIVLPSDRHHCEIKGDLNVNSLLLRFG